MAGAGRGGLDWDVEEEKEGTKEREKITKRELETERKARRKDGMLF